MPNYYTILTEKGKAKLAAAQNGTPVQIAEFALGDGNGSDIVPSEAMTALVHEVHKRPVNSIYIHAQNPSWTVVEVVVPQDVGGFTVREIGMYDADGDLFAIGGYPATYKPLLDSGVGKELCIRAVLTISNASTIKLSIDPSVVTATREFVDRAMETHNDSPTAHGAAFQALANHIEDTDDPHQTIPAGGEPGQVLIRQQDGSLAWGSVGGMPVGTLHFPSTGKPDPGSVAVNVKQKFLRTVYPQLVARVLNDGGYLATEEAWDAAAAANEGSCGRYALTDTHIILPCYRHYWAAAQAGIEGKAAGDWAGDAIRNITGEWEGAAATGLNPPEGLGAIRASYISGQEAAGVTGPSRGFSFDASRVVPTADENRPKTSYLLPCIKVADVPTNAAEVDMLALAALVAEINGNKVDRSEWVTLVPDRAWQRPDGIIEQIGTVSFPTSGDSSLAIIFPIPFPNKTLHGEWHIWDASLSSVIGTNVRDVGLSGMTLVADKDTAQSITVQAHYYAFGR
ncbi:phage tail protein [Desulfovibrio mangrovi]|uniref:phage tail protein n=1 Tax=Desulfovibrio mangrovi TaxID=2976983 RepID=UPI002248630F|nr:phage tail protein [Desulfovibrio mangrovi]UZP67644.1 phage tail protein [Desulfovibrio mangrovi]